MRAYIYGIWLSLRMDLRNRDILLLYYLVPIIFYLFMGGVFTSIMPGMKETLIQSMVVFGTTMGGMLGVPDALVKVYHTEIKKAYQVWNIPMGVPFLNNFISATIHLFLMNLVIYFSAPLIYGAQKPQNPILFFAMLLLFILTTVSIGSLIGMFSRKSSIATMYGQCIFLPSVMIGGIMFPSNLLPAALRMVSKLLPATWGFTALTVDKLSVISMLVLIVMLVITFSINQVAVRLRSSN